MNTSNIILTVFLTVGLLLMFWVTIMLQKYKNFKRFLKEGDMVDFYIGEERETFKLISMEGDFSKIRGRDNITRRVLTSQLFPNMRESYKPK